MRFWQRLDFHQAQLSVFAIELRPSSGAPFAGVTETKRIELHHEFRIKSTSDESGWQHVQVTLPVRLESHFRLAVRSAAGPLNDIPIDAHRPVRLANLSLSKECFSIGTHLS
jgi:hypothetical protein